MALTGPRDGPGLGPPAPLVDRLDAVAAAVESRSRQLGRAVSVDPLVLLTERAAITGARRQGQVSCGGATRLLDAADGWLAVTLARSDDVDLVPAWLGLPGPPADTWESVASAAASRPAADLVRAGAELGLPVAALGEAEPPHGATHPRPEPLSRNWTRRRCTELPGELPVGAVQLDDAPAVGTLDGVVVVELASLWAGPLCGSLLADAGATVVKVESTARPDGARRGSAEFFDLLNAGKRSVALDLAGDEGRRTLAALVARADVLIEGSRPRALAQLGIDAESLVCDGGPRVWVSITGHGRGRGDRVGFGDDAAVAGGLVAWDGHAPCFCADAVADPTSGLVAAAAVLEALAAGGRWLLDVALAGVAAHLAGPTLPVASGVEAAPPARRPPRGRAADLGEHTAEVLDELRVEP